jgi:steroid delta-isomerase-like uncharacterized protein
MPTPEEQTALDLLDRFVAAENAHDIGAFDVLMHPELKVWGNGILVRDTWAGYREVMAATLAAFPDSHREVQMRAAQGDLAVFRWIVTGTHMAPWNGIPASGKPVSFTGTSWIRARGDRVAEAWFDMDMAGPLRQMTA